MSTGSMAVSEGSASPVSMPPRSQLLGALLAAAVLVAGIGFGAGFLVGRHTAASSSRSFPGPFGQGGFGRQFGVPNDGSTPGR